MKRENKINILPSGYQQLQYLQSTGTQYVDTGLLSNPDQKWIFKVQFTGNNESEVQRFGWGSENYNDAVFVYYNENNSYMRLMFSKNWSGYSDVTVSSSILRGVNDIVLSNSELSINGTSYGTGTIDRIGLGTIYLFSCHIAWSPYINYAKMRFFNTTVIENGEYVRNFIPALRLSDNKPGLYDLCGSICPLTNTPFYVNAGTGEFLYQ